MDCCLLILCTCRGAPSPHGLRVSSVHPPMEQPPDTRRRLTQWLAVPKNSWTNGLAPQAVKKMISFLMILVESLRAGTCTFCRQVDGPGERTPAYLECGLSVPAPSMSAKDSGILPLIRFSGP